MQKVHVRPVASIKVASRNVNQPLQDLISIAVCLKMAFITRYATQSNVCADCMTHVLCTPKYIYESNAETLAER